MKVSLCTIALNEERALNGLLRDFRDQNYPHQKIEIIMVDNGSTDNSLDIMKEFCEIDNGFYNVQVYQNTSGHRNQAAAWNVALEHRTLIWHLI